MRELSLFNFIIALAFCLCYAYQLAYLAVPLLRREKPLPPSRREHRFAVLICARNEEAVIGDLLESLEKQTYPRDKLRIFVMADNCTDRTAAIARAKGAEVFLRQDRERVGKGYALEALLEQVARAAPRGFDGYFVFDADNLLAPDFIEEMDRCFSQGHDVVTAYRNSKNYGDSWVSAGCGLWFLRESRYLNEARYLLGVSAAVSGTGFLFSRAVLEELGGWPFHLLTEDVEFSAWQILRGRRIAFCRRAVFYDEQPITFRQSWRQRLRWSRGYLQVLKRYGPGLVKGALKGSFSCFDMAMNILPMIVLTALSLTVNLVLGVRGALAGDDLTIALVSVGQSLGNTYLMLFLLGAFTTLTEWKQIRASVPRKLLYVFTFPLFMITYLPVSAASLVCRPGWKPIRHTVSAGSLREKGVSLQ